MLPPPLGTRFQDGKLVIMPEFVEEDRGRDRDKVVGELLRTMADSITPMLLFEEDVCSNYQDGKLPILDLKVWKAQSQEGPTLIRHDFYKKPMASQATLRASTAYPTPQLRAIMTEEVLRRLRNCSPESTWEERGKHLTEFALSLKSSGHNEKFRVTVFRKAVARFEKELTNHNEGVADIYRSREERNKQTEARGGKSSKDTWFRQKSDNGETVTSVLRVPFMPGNKLKKRAEEVLKNHKSPAGLHTKVQEGGGSKLEHSLMRSDPFPRQRCQRADCPVGTEDRAAKTLVFRTM